MTLQRFSFCFACVLVFLGLGGCSSVSSVNPVGRSLTSDLSGELSGSWMGAEGHQLQIHCDSGGALSFAVTEWKEDEEKFVLDTGEGLLREIGDQIIFNNAEDEGEYTFFLIRALDGQLVVWSPDVDEFRALVDDEILAGRVEDDDHSTQIILTGTSEEISALIENLDCSKLFDWSEPTTVLVRINVD